MYKLTKNECVIRIADWAFIPTVIGNADYDEYLRWVQAGNSPIPADEEEEKPPQYPHFVGNQKLDLFTQAEQLAVVTATMSDPMVKLLYDRLLGSAYMTYEDPETEQGLAVLVEKGLLTPERKAAIVTEMQPR
jgi:hypothetical protein